MIKANLQAEIHQFIIYDLAIRTLNYDLPKIEDLKLQVVLQPIVQHLLKKLYEEFNPLKVRLKREGIAIVKWQHVDSFFSDVILRTAGEDQTLRYAKKVLQYDVEQLVWQKLNTMNIGLKR